jgi:hypothetical protein
MAQKEENYMTDIPQNSPVITLKACNADGAFELINDLQDVLDKHECITELGMGKMENGQYVVYLTSFELNKKVAKIESEIKVATGA